MPVMSLLEVRARNMSSFALQVLFVCATNYEIAATYYTKLGDHLPFEYVLIWKGGAVRGWVIMGE